jgi:CrcB protein
MIAVWHVVFTFGFQSKFWPSIYIRGKISRTGSAPTENILASPLGRSFLPENLKRRKGLETLTKYLAVAAGSALGGMLRYYLGGTALSRLTGSFPLATFVINITGSFIIGFFLTLVAGRISLGQPLRLAIAVGFVGAYTTFSTFEYETARLVEERHVMLALLNIILSVVVGFIAVWGGIIAARKLDSAPAMDDTTYLRFERQADTSDPAQMPGAARDIRDATIEVKRRT